MSNTLDYQAPDNKKRWPWRFIVPVGFVFLLLATSIILPTLDRLRYASNRPPGASNLHQIGLGILLYQNDYGGKMPGTLTDLVLHEGMSPEMLIDPFSNDTPAKGATPQAIIADIARGGHQTFVYLGAGLTGVQISDPTTVIAYEPLSVYQNGTNALFGDGHTEWLTPEQLKKALAPKPTTATATRPTTGP